jgi:hypothetical protein
MSLKLKKYAKKKATWQAAVEELRLVLAADPRSFL